MKLDNLSNPFIKVVTFLISRQVADNKYRSKEASQYIKVVLNEKLIHKIALYIL